MFFCGITDLESGDAMKPKKALKKLTKTEELLSDVIDRYAARDHTLHAHLDTAITSVRSAKESLDGETSSRSAKTPKEPKADKPRNEPLPPAQSKKVMKKAATDPKFKNKTTGAKKI
jgi:DNA replication initiation complex subunit (GINS family)